MLQITPRISIEGIDTEKELNEYLEEQEKNEPNENIIKMFKWFLMKIEEDAKSNTYNQRHCDSLDKYAVKVIQRKLMKEDDVINFVRQALEGV